MFTALRVTCVGLLLGTVLAVWHSQSIAVDERIDHEYRQELRTLQASETSLSSDLLETRAGLVTHYDALVGRIAELRRLSESLSSPPAFVSKSGRADIEDAVRMYLAVLMEQEEFIETFKFNHAVLRNSLRFFPGEALALAESVSRYPEGQTLSTKLNAFYSDVLLFYLFNASQPGPSLDEQITSLTVDVPSWLSEEDTLSIKLLTEHVLVIMKRKPQVDGAVMGMLQRPSAARVRELGEAYASSYSRASAAAKRAELLSWILILAFVLAASAYIILRLRRSGRALARATAKLEDAMASLGIEKEKHKELAELKSRFVSMTSHEFRTPLSVVLSSAELLQAYGERWPEEKKQTHLVRVQDAAKYMKQMLDDVLLIGRAEAGKLEPECRPVDIDAFCSDLIETLRLQFDSEHEVQYTTRGELSALVVDQQLLMHILDNLLSNAFKYSEENTVIEFDVIREDGFLNFSIKDKGIGISKDDLQRLFETFHRGENVGDVSGTGLGLAVVKKSLDVLQGTISVESKLGEGSTFVVRMPAPTAAREKMRDSA